MNGEHPSKDRLQRHYDGDLPELEAADVRQHLRSCIECQHELAALERMSDMVRWTTDDAAATTVPDFTRMFSEIERGVGVGVGVEQQRAENSANVVPLNAKGSNGDNSDKRGGAPQWLHRAAPAMGAFALAAAALLMVYRAETVPSEASGESGSEPIAALDAAHHSEIVAVKFGTNAGQVFGIPLADGSSVPVVWIDDVDEEE